MLKSQTTRNYQRGIGKSKHKLSDYVKDGLKQIIINQTNFFLREEHTMREVTVFYNWLTQFELSFPEIKDYDWYSSTNSRVIQEVEIKPYK